MKKINSIKEIAIKAAKEAGVLLMKNLGKQTILDNSIANLSTKEDKNSELLILKIIQSNFPNHGFLGEEFGEKNIDSEYKWIIDPIDGTNNYINGRDTFSVSIGLEYKGKIILGVVYLPKRNELFVAEKNKGTTLNDKTIQVKDNPNLKEAVITYSVYPGSEKIFKKITEKIINTFPKVKFFGFKGKKGVDPVFGRGSMAAEFCYLACGRIDGLIRLKQKPWDVAAGSLIASEAGAKMTNLEGKECGIYEGNYIAANPSLYKKVMNTLTEVEF